MPGQKSVTARVPRVFKIASDFIDIRAPLKHSLLVLSDLVLPVEFQMCLGSHKCLFPQSKHRYQLN